MSATTIQDKLRKRLGRVYGARSSQMLDALLKAYASALEDVGAQCENAVAQIGLDTAGTLWLDQHGTLYRVARRSPPLERDTPYAARIFEETIRQRTQPFALEAIVRDAYGITVKVRTLWPYILQSDQLTTPENWPLNVSDGFTGMGTDVWPSGVSFGEPFASGVFGVWVYLSISDPYILTLAQTLALFPTMLLSDKVETDSLHVSDGQLVTPASAARVSFSPLLVELPVSDAELLSVLDAHRAAGTRPIIIDHIAV